MEFDFEVEFTTGWPETIDVKASTTDKAIIKALLDQPMREILSVRQFFSPSKPITAT